MAAPLRITRAYVAAGIAPHGFTQRWTYTVPAGRECAVNLLSVLMQRDGAAGAVGLSAIYIELIPAAGAAPRPLEAHMYDAALATGRVDQLWGGEFRIVAGDTLNCWTVDGSTGGTVRYMGSLIGYEYDAW